MSHGAGSDQDVELNIASLIDCFTVLIAFMLASASFLSIGLLDAGVAAPSENASTTPPPIQVEVALDNKGVSTLKITGSARHTQSFREPAALKQALKDWKSKFPTVGGATLVASDDVPYNEVVASMSQVREIYPAVLLGGFGQ